jgi:SAM-dependent methyltransferase
MLDAATYLEIRRLALAGGLWSCQPDRLRPAADGRRMFSGWVVPPGALPRAFTILANGSPLPHAPLPQRTGPEGFVDYVLARCGLEGRREEFGFQIELPANPDADIELSIRFSGLTGRAETLPFLVPARPPAVEPSRLVMERTTHIRDPYVFHYNGATDFHRLQLLYAAAAQSPPPRPRVLDWGCGCGRVSRFMEAAHGAEAVVGVDIDAVGIAWLHEHGGQGRYRRIGGNPQLPFTDDAFDLVYGISVMTHLRQEDQRRWLEELSRVLAPGGVAILTFHSLAMFFAHVNDGSSLAQLLTAGFWDYGRCADLDEGSPAAAAADTYRNVFNTPGNIRDLCPGGCEVVDVVAGGSSAQHDYVVFRKRSVTR